MHDTKHLPRRMLAATGVAAALALGLGSVQAQQPATPQAEVQQSMPRGPQMGGQGPAMGQPGPRGRHRGDDWSQPMPERTLRDVYDRVQAAGYRDLREIELDRGRWEVKALDAEGNPVKLYVSGSSGEIEYVKRKGSNQRRHDRRSSWPKADSGSPAQRQYGASTQVDPYYDHAMRPVVNNALPGTSAWGWHYYSEPAAQRAVVISPAGAYYYSQGDGPRWIYSVQGRDGSMGEAPSPQVRRS